MNQTDPVRTYGLLESFIWDASLFTLREKGLGVRRVIMQIIMSKLWFSNSLISFLCSCILSLSDYLLLC